ncbi:MAG: glycosyltransferase family 4 protein [Rhodothermales bacterium]
MHIAVFYQYYHNPDCAATGRHYTFIKHWSERHQVTLITTNTWRGQRLTRRFDWVPPGVRLLELDVAYANAMTVPQRLFAFGRYALGALRHGLTIPKPDVIFGTSTPLSAAWIAGQVARLRGVPWVFEVRDLWPDFPIQMGAVTNGWLQRRLYAAERRLYQSAAHVVPLSPDMERHVRAQGIPPERITMLFNGTDLDLAAQATEADVRHLRRQFGLGDRRVVLYAGTFGRANDLPTLITAAERLAHRGDLCFVFAGDGYYLDTLRSAEARLPNVRVLPPQPRHGAFALFKLAELALVPFLGLPVLAANSPAKFFDSLAVGTPVLVTNPGWTKAFVEEHRCGWFVPASCPDVLAQWIDDLFGRPGALVEAGAHGQAVAERTFGRVEQARTLEDLFQRVVGNGTAGTPT